VISDPVSGTLILVDTPERVARSARRVIRIRDGVILNGETGASASPDAGGPAGRAAAGGGT
jgi:hypothetical protein